MRFTRHEFAVTRSWFRLAKIELRVSTAPAHIPVMMMLLFLKHLIIKKSSHFNYLVVRFVLTGAPAYRQNRQQMPHLCYTFWYIFRSVLSDAPVLPWRCVYRRRRWGEVRVRPRLCRWYVRKRYGQREGCSISIGVISCAVCRMSIYIRFYRWEIRSIDTYIANGLGVVSKSHTGSRIQLHWQQLILPQT